MNRLKEFIEIYEVNYLELLYGWYTLTIFCDYAQYKSAAY